MMRILPVMLVLLMTVALGGCITKSKEPRSKILCPACGTEFEPIFQERF